jgi:hypothetical protein
MCAFCYGARSALWRLAKAGRYALTRQSPPKPVIQPKKRGAASGSASVKPTTATVGRAV